jgi:hypothetical protein
VADDFRWIPDKSQVAAIWEDRAEMAWGAEKELGYDEKLIEAEDEIAVEKVM